MQKKYFQPEMETMPVEEIKKIQDEKLVKQVRYVYENVKYYRDLMDERESVLMISREQTTCTSFRLSRRTIFVKHIHMDCLQLISGIVSGYSQLRERQEKE